MLIELDEWEAKDVVMGLRGMARRKREQAALIQGDWRIRDDLLKSAEQLERLMGKIEERLRAERKAPQE